MALEAEKGQSITSKQEGQCKNNLSVTERIQRDLQMIRQSIVDGQGRPNLSQVKFEHVADVVGVKVRHLNQVLAILKCLAQFFNP